MSFNKNKKEMFKKTTLDKKHNEQINKFNYKNDSKELLQKDLDQKISQLEEINSIDFKDYTPNIIAKKADLNKDINLLKKKNNKYK